MTVSDRLAMIEDRLALISVTLAKLVILLEKAWSVTLNGEIDK